MLDVLDLELVIVQNIGDGLFNHPRELINKNQTRIQYESADEYVHGPQKLGSINIRVKSTAWQLQNNNLGGFRFEIWDDMSMILDESWTWIIMLFDMQLLVDLLMEDRLWFSGSWEYIFEDDLMLDHLFMFLKPFVMIHNPVMRFSKKPR